MCRARPTFSATTKAQNPVAILCAAYQDEKPSQWLSERTGVPAVVLPFTVGGDDQAKDLFGLFDSTSPVIINAMLDKVVSVDLSSVSEATRAASSAIEHASRIASAIGHQGFE